MTIDQHHLACLEAALDLALESPRGPDGALTPEGKAHVKAALDQAEHDGPLHHWEAMSEADWACFAASDWQPYTVTRGKNKGKQAWKHVKSGRISYEDPTKKEAAKKEADEAKRKAKEEAAAKVKAAAAAKVKARQDAQVALAAKKKAAEDAKAKAAAAKEAAAKQAREQRQQAAQHIRDVVSGSAATTPAKVKAAGAHLLSMTATELRALKTEIGAKGGGAAKAGLVEAITARALAARKAGKGKTPPAKPAKPAVKSGPDLTAAAPDNPLLRAMANIEPDLQEGALVSIADIRKALPGVSKGQLDTALLDLMNNGLLAGHRHDFPDSAQHTAIYGGKPGLVADGKGNHFMGFTLDTRTPEGKAFGAAADPKFTGTDALGRKWVNGKLVAAQEKPLRDPKQAQEEYVREGTRAPAFKDWFGDWEKDPAKASKVVKADGSPAEQNPLTHAPDDRGQPIVVYHGTPWDEFDSFDRSKIANPEALLYGGGFYFTDSPDVAADYRARGSGIVSGPKPTLKPGLDGTKAAKRLREMLGEAAPALRQKVKDLEEEAERQHRAAQAARASGHDPAAHLRQEEVLRIQIKEADRLAGFAERHSTGSMLFNKREVENGNVFGQFGHELKAILGDRLAEVADLPKGHTFEVYLNIRNPFDAKEGRIKLEDLPADAREKILGKIGHGTFGGKTFDQLTDDDWQTLHKAFKRAHPQLSSAAQGWMAFKQRFSHSPTALADWASTYKGFRTQLEKLGMPAGRSYPFPSLRWKDLHKGLGSKGKANDLLESMGYDGLTHMGSFGARAGTVVPGAAAGHRVWIAFQPHQIKAKGNTGEFDPSNPSIKHTEGE